MNNKNFQINEPLKTKNNKHRKEKKTPKKVTVNNVEKYIEEMQDS